MPAENEPAEPNALTQSLQLTCSLTPKSTLPSTRLVIIWLKRCPARSLIDPAFEPGRATGGGLVAPGVDVGLGVVGEYGGRVCILRRAAKTCRRAAGCGKRPWRVVGLLDRRPAAAARSDDGGVAGTGELDAFKAHRADRGRAVLQIDDGLAAL